MKSSKRLRNFWGRWLCGLTLASSLSGRTAGLPGDWQFEQRFDVPAPGLIRLSLPIQTLDAARPGLEDLRLYDDAGVELPFVVEHPRTAGKIVQRAKSFQVSLNPAATSITIETGLAQPIDALTLETPAATFIKSVQIEGSADATAWQTLARGQPIFRQAGGADQLRLNVPVGVWRWLRLTVDDARTEPIPFVGARIQAAAGESAPSEELPVSLGDRNENPGESRLTVNLGAANLELAAVSIETSEPLFTRQVTVAVPKIVGDSIREEPLARGAIYRIAIEGQPSSASLRLPFEAQARSRELLLLIQNQDSPVLPITAIRVERRPVHLVFLARRAGLHHLLAGNRNCAAPKYDLAALGANLPSAPVERIAFSPSGENPNYRAPEVLVGIQAEGAALDVSPWAFRKSLKLETAGVQQLELDLDVLGHAQPGFEDLRLLRDARQLPYILEHTSISRSLTPAVTAGKNAQDPKITRWVIKLPQAAPAVTRLSCRTRTPLFQRDATLFEEVTDERGEPYRRSLGAAVWIQTPAHPNSELFLAIDARPKGDTLFLETNNGDNPPIDLSEFRLFYPATRVLFKSLAGDGMYLYYGNPEAISPSYDLSLVAATLLAANKATAAPGPEVQLKKAPWTQRQIPAKGGIVFWGMLALVVVVLLVIIARLLPKPTSGASDQ